MNFFLSQLCKTYKIIMKKEIFEYLFYLSRLGTHKKQAGFHWVFLLILATMEGEKERSKLG